MSHRSTWNVGWYIIWLTNMRAPLSDLINSHLACKGWWGFPLTLLITINPMIIKPIRKSLILRESPVGLTCHLSVSGGGRAALMWVWWIQWRLPATLTTVGVVRMTGEGLSQWGSGAAGCIFFTQIQSPGEWLWGLSAVQGPVGWQRLSVESLFSDCKDLSIEKLWISVAFSTPTLGRRGGGLPNMILYGARPWR